MERMLKNSLTSTAMDEKPASRFMFAHKEPKKVPPKVQTNKAKSIERKQNSVKPLNTDKPQESIQPAKPGHQNSDSPAKIKSNSPQQKEDPNARYFVFIEDVHVTFQYAEIQPPRIFGQRYELNLREFPSEGDKQIFNILSKYLNNGT